MTDREAIAEALQNFWQGPSGRSWAECNEKLAPQAEWFRKLADVAIAAGGVAQAQSKPGLADELRRLAENNRTQPGSYSEGRSDGLELAAVMVDRWDTSVSSTQSGGRQ